MALDPIARRLAGLDRLTQAADGETSPDFSARQGLRELRERASAPAAAAVRVGFVRRVPVLDKSEIGNQRIVDRPRPKLPRRPPLSTLTSLPKGVALRTALTLLFVIQSDPRTLDTKTGQLRLPLLQRSASHPPLAELVAVDAQFTADAESDYAADRISNRDQQIKSALIGLSKPGIGITELPDRRRGKDGFADVRLYAEDGRPRPGRYQPPQPLEPTIDIPADFYLNGWINALTSGEIAMWLMLRDLTALAQHDNPAHNGWVRINATDRLLRYDLTRSTWDAHHTLAEFGLLEVEKDARRRPDGTVQGGRPQASVPNFFKLNDRGLGEPGIETVQAALTRRAAGSQ